jgi:hypothetical protein
MRTVKELCSGRTNFVSRDLCESRECRKPQHQNEPFCRQLRETEASRNQQRSSD